MEKMTNLIGILNLKAKWPKKKKSLETKMIVYVNLKDVTLDVRLKKFYPANRSYHFGYSYFYFYNRLILVLLILRPLDSKKNPSKHLTWS